MSAAGSDLERFRHRVELERLRRLPVVVAVRRRAPVLCPVHGRRDWEPCRCAEYRASGGDRR
jgi:hypothetical protein